MQKCTTVYLILPSFESHITLSFDYFQQSMERNTNIGHITERHQGKKKANVFSGINKRRCERGQRENFQQLNCAEVFQDVLMFDDFNTT